MARTQTSARGSRGRSWTEADGTLALSVLLRPRVAGGLWPFIAGLALYEALCLSPAYGAALRLKWPNDVMLRDRKLAGILIEANPAPVDQGWLVIGFGANLRAAPALEGRGAACLAELGPVPPAQDVALRLLGRLAEWREDHDGSVIRREWLARAHPPGTKLAVSAGDVQTTGLFSTVAEDGTLLLDVAGEIRRFNTGEVLLPRGA